VPVALSEEELPEVLSELPMALEPLVLLELPTSEAPEDAPVG